jgi:hypothetical protein
LFEFAGLFSDLHSRGSCQVAKKDCRNRPLWVNLWVRISLWKGRRPSRLRDGVILLSHQMPTRPNHRFEVGQAYRDHRATYKVVSVEGNRVVYDYGDGIQHEGDAEIKWRIHTNILLSEQHPLPTASSPQGHRPASHGQFWTYDEVAAIFVEVVAVYGKRHTDFMTHKKMVAAFTEHPEGKRILERPHDGRSNDYWVGVMLAWFSRTFTEGRSEWENRLERKKIGSAWAYRLRL